MKKLLFILFIAASPAYAQIDSMQVYLDSLKVKLQPARGTITLADGIGTLVVPEKFGYLNPEQTRFVIEDMWGNPDGKGTLGMLIPDEPSVLDDAGWAFIITYEEMGYVKDDDADDIDYDDLLEELQADIKIENEERAKLGYESYELIGWASSPYYDTERKMLHWAKEIRFGESEFNTLNYNIRVLGRKGVLMLNAVATMDQLQLVKDNINPVLASFQYADGNKYSDFNPELDEVAAWTIGGLVAGKVLAKAGFFALILKNIKLIFIALAAAGTGFWQWFKRRTQPPDVKDITKTES
jgi:uncharacterized membrane-anchored protein